jgi:DNA-binding Lrp family transcriptional regulator
MPASAYILINVEPASTQAVFDRLSAIPGAVVHEVLGPYDMIVDLETDSQEDITAVLRHRIRPIHGITNTLTCICLR